MFHKDFEAHGNSLELQKKAIFLTHRQWSLIFHSFASVKNVSGGKFDSAFTMHYLNEALSSVLSPDLV